MSDEKRTDCAHVSNVSIQAAEALTYFNEYCSKCQHSRGFRWLCLFENCRFVGCGAKINNHAEQHASEKNHSLQLNLKNGRVWCHKCESEVLAHNSPSWSFLDELLREKNLASKKRSFDKCKESIIPYPDASKISIADEKNVGKLIENSPVVDRFAEIDNRQGINFFAAGRLYNQRDRISAVPYIPDYANEFQVPGLVGLRNLGNTCYMNAVLQALSNCPPLTEYLLNCRLPIDYKQCCLALVYRKLTKDMWNDQKPISYVSPVDLLQIMRSIYPTFRSFQQQDAQEFLRCFLDALHDDLKQPVYEWECNKTADRWSSKRGRISSEEKSDSEKSSAKRDKTDDNGNNERKSVDSDSRSNVASCSSSSSVDDDNFKTCDSGWSSDTGITFHSKENSEKSSYNLRKRRNVKSECFSSSSSLSSKNFPKAESIPNLADNTEQAKLSSPSSMNRRLGKPQKAIRCSPERVPPRKAVRYRSIVSDVFDGRLLSSVQCLTCNTISETRETFQDLSLSIPSREQLDLLKNTKRSQQQLQNSPNLSPSSANSNLTSEQSWLWWSYNWLWSWVSGPKITLEDCLAAFFSADELKGDDMYRCDRCKKLRNGVKYCSLLSLPEVLCIHLKRFRHETSYSSKINARVEFPLENLNLSPFVHKHSKDEVQTYDLTAVICHRGSFEGGHYTSYCQNPNNFRWYEFDDQFATEVDDFTVRNAEAYVLFYRKRSDNTDRLRAEIEQLDRVTKVNSTHFYVSREWIHRFNTFAEPGPITNFDFLCPHGWIAPSKAESLPELYCEIPEKIWHLLYKEFGGGPVCLELRHCFECQQHRKRVLVKRQLELETFTRLQKQLRAIMNPADYSNYCLNTKWFRQWDDFVNEREEEPPGPIRNSELIAKRSDKSEPYRLTAGASYLKISGDMWHFFVGCYGGGPEILLSPNGLNITSVVALK